MKNKIIISLVFFVTSFSLLFAQGTMITGNVKEASTSDPMPGVTVQLKGKNLATSTDLDGNYSIAAQKGDVLVFSFLGMKPLSVTVTSDSPLNVKLEDDNVSLDQVVVIGYGTVKKSDLTGAVSSISAKDMQADIAQNTASALQGRIPGVSVSNTSGRPGAGMNINVRGVSSLTNNTPLYVIDGVYGDINMLDPADIASIEVLKDASAAAIYGSRAASGVVIITTIAGRKDTPSKIRLNVYAGIQQLPKKMDVLNGPEWLSVVNAPSDSKYAANLSGNGTDWQDEVYRTGTIYKANLGISGGSKTSVYSTSLGYINQEGIMINSKYEAFNMRTKNQYSFLNNKLRLGESLILKIAKDKGVDNPAVVTQTLRMSPIVPVHDETRLGGWASTESWMTNVANPVGDIHANSSWDNNFSRLTQILINAYAEADLYKGLRYKLNLGINQDNGTTKAFRDIYNFGNAGMNELPDLKEGSSESHSWLLENTLNYDNTFGKHTVSGLLGYSAQRYKYRVISAGREELPIGVGTINGGSADSQSASGSANENSIVSAFGRLMYSYDSRYMFSFSVRRDGSSRFADGHRYGTFPSASAGWNIQNEKFAEPLKTVFDELKLRASYGKLGNQEIGNYLTQSTVRRGINYVQGSSWWMGGMPGINWVSPQDLTWEETATSNIGLDASLFNGKLAFTADAFIQTTDGVLLGINMPSSTGLTGSPILNAGQIENKGLELSLTHRNSVGKVYYSLTGNISTIQNKVKKITIGNQQEFPGYSPQGLGTVTWAKVGDPIGSFYLVKTDGIFQNKEEIQAYKDKNGNLIQPNAEPGDIRFVDANGDGSITDGDARYAGSPFPDFSFGFRANAEWNNFDISFFFDGMSGNKIFNFTRYRMESMIDITNYGSRVLDAWTPTNTHTSMPRFEITDPNKNSRVASDRWLEDGSFIRLKTFEFGYTLPKAMLSKLNIEHLRIFSACENLFTITGYKGYTPDLGENNHSNTGTSSALTRGTDHGRYPIPRVISFGIQFYL